MKFLKVLFKKNKTRKTLSDYQREMLVKQGREQFKKLIQRGLNLPVALL